jgi:hypothetical protein
MRKNVTVPPTPTLASISAENGSTISKPRKRTLKSKPYAGHVDFDRPAAGRDQSVTVRAGSARGAGPTAETKKPAAWAASFLE